jgi:hypothetical protein
MSLRTDLGETLSDDYRTILMNRISWGAVLAGVAVALVVQLLLNLLSTGIGIGMIDPYGDPAERAGIVTLIAMIWWTLSGILAAYAGGMAAGRLSGRPSTTIAGWHGLVAWALSVLIVFWLITASLGAVIGGAFSTLGNVAGGAGQAAAAVAPAVLDDAGPMAGITPQIRELAGGNDPAAGAEVIGAYVAEAFAGGPGADAARERAANAIASATGVTPAEAEERLAAWETQYRQAVEATREAADAARKAIAGAAVLAFIALVFGGLAGWFGGATNAPELERAGTRATAWLDRRGVPKA